MLANAEQTSASSQKYAVPEEARRLLKLLIRKNPALQIPEKFVDSNIHFKGDALPALPGGLKSGAFSAACSAAFGAVADQIAQDRYGGEASNITIDTDHAGYFLASPLLCKYENEAPDWENTDLRSKPLYACATGIYPTKDGRWFQLHGDLDCIPMLQNVGILNSPDDTSTLEEAREIYSQWTMLHNADELEAMMVKYRHSGSKCYKPEEWLATDMGKALADKPLCDVRQLTPPENPTPYPSASKKRILEGIKVVEMVRIIAGPVIGKTLAELGAQVIRVNPPHLRDLTWLQHTLTAGSHTVSLDARQPKQKAQLEELIAQADVFIDGYRPGSLERLGFGKQRVMELAGRNIIYVDESCYGVEGPYSGRPGWQQIADAASGVSVVQAQTLGMDNHALLPPLPITDLLTGVLGATSTLCALRDRARKGGSYRVVASLTALDMFFISEEVGIYPSEIVQKVEQTFGFGVIQASDHVRTLAARITKAWKLRRPDHMDFEGRFFAGFDNGPFGRMKIVAPVAQLDKYPSKWDASPRPYGYDQPTFLY
ncbi:CoA-transferase family III domain-containing protein [Zychaea mexicana]|uniref:CoA-transferase family III domain-containing protein n=1 Tax=Zychaea mexicana TaxID=64656 RepID=UPI0022FDD2BA|nr:CoA-transferase family III domain-containing protein [Zychaea mexicana]KAI9497100.1 CoA-transferase family III domain-containing protein [Zychaea mexicana]